MPIKGYSDPLLNGSLGMLTDGQYEGVETINRSAQRLQTLMNQLIQFASSVKGKRVVNPTIIHVPDLVEPLWDYFQPKADAAGVRRVREVPASLPLARADAEKIYWVPFSRAADGTGQWVDGTGRGLALDKRIVEAHDARVEVESRLGQGSLFAFELPLVHPPAE